MSIDRDVLPDAPDTPSREKMILAFRDSDNFANDAVDQIAIRQIQAGRFVFTRHGGLQMTKEGFDFNREHGTKQ